MTVQAAPGPIVMGTGDFQRTDRGITWGIKFRNLGIGYAVFVVVKQSDGSWAQPAATESYLESSFEDAMKTMDVTTWVKNVFIPRLNAWLKKAFPAVGAPAPTPVTIDEKFAAADAQVFGNLRITVAADSTLSASA